ncbi:MAG: radical SAM protein [Clostridia bacterium]|nr:radical SAM protein [Clostridia bacterium]
MEHALVHFAADKALSRILRYIDKAPEKNLLKLLNIAGKTFKFFPQKNFVKMKEAVSDKDNVYMQMFKNILADVDRDLVKSFLLSMGVHAGYYGTKTVRANRDKYNCNIPFTILFDPTSACNLKCKGCWAAEYGHSMQLSLDEMRSIVSQGRDLGTHFYMLTGGEPLIRKADIITLASENPECTFLIYTNATLVDKKLCDDIKKCGNITLALSIEGDEASNDFRRGDGAYRTTIDAMKLLKAEKLLFGISVCYTSKNINQVTSDEFLDKMVDMGVKYAFYFNYMPVGKDADKSLIPTPSQRKYMYFWMKKVRNAKTGKPLFVMDFQDDGEYVGGCIAGGRNYFHINSNGDIEPCVFVHYSDSNIRTHTLFEALNNPLFMAYRKGQPFNDNHLMPCPMLENPDILRKMVKETGAKSTDFISKETVDELCAKCEDFSKAWAPVAKDIWDNNPHPVTHTQYYRDTPEGRKENKN